MADRSFELVESIRFFAQLVGTEGVSASAKETANGYIEAMLLALRPSIQDQVDAMSPINIMRQ